MSALDQHIVAPDVGIVTSDLFIYYEKRPGTGGLVTKLRPRDLLSRQTTFIQTDTLHVSFLLDRENNMGQVTLHRLSEPTSCDRKVFALTKEFQNQVQVTLTVLFAEWEIVAVIDGEPMVLSHKK